MLTRLFENLASESALVRLLRFGGFLCFVGHGAFGVITKPGWVPYFGVVGIGPEMAYQLMPIVGWIDIAIGFLVLLTPRPVVLLWMLGWTITTALMRPLAGEPVWETLERAGNYGVPAALLLCIIPAHRVRDWVGALRERIMTPQSLARLRTVLVVACALLLVGHGMLGVNSKAGLIKNLASVLPQSAATVTPMLGWFEIALAVAIVAFRSAPLALFIAIWKLVTESLFIAVGAPIWEVIERGGSYIVPFALCIVLLMSKRMMNGSSIPVAGPQPAT